jgi:hypothetical protein
MENGLEGFRNFPDLFVPYPYRMETGHVHQFQWQMQERTCFKLESRFFVRQHTLGFPLKKLTLRLRNWLTPFHNIKLGLKCLIFSHFKALCDEHPPMHPNHLHYILMSAFCTLIRFARDIPRLLYPHSYLIVIFSGKRQNFQKNTLNYKTLRPLICLWAISYLVTWFN